MSPFKRENAAARSIPSRKRDRYFQWPDGARTIKAPKIVCERWEAAMRCTAMLFAMLMTYQGAMAQDAARPITPAEAAKKVDQQVTVEFEVKSTGGERNRYLNSATDFSAANNFTIFIPQAAMPKFVAAKIEKPDEYFYGKVIQVTGTGALARSKPQVVVTD